MGAGKTKERKREIKEEGTVKEGLKQVENSMGVGGGLYDEF